MIKNYWAKWTYLMRRQQGCCAIAKAHDKYAIPTEPHHRAHRIDWAVKKFPLFIDSVWNLLAVSRDWHMMYPSFGKISWEEAERREKFLQRHPLIAKAVNCEEEP